MSGSARAFRAAPAIVALGLLLFGGPALAAVRTVAIDGTKFDPETVTVDPSVNDCVPVCSRASVC